ESSGVEDRRIDRPRHQPLDTVPDADDLPALLTGAMQHDRAQDRVEPGAVAAAGENADSPFRTHVSLPGRRAVAFGGLYHAAEWPAWHGAASGITMPPAGQLSLSTMD